MTKGLFPQDALQAAELLRSGGLVGIPTETVYGLGANGLDPEAVAGIFRAKGRPQDNPLILHIPDASWLNRYCRDIPQSAWDLAERFWPGPMTMILKRDPIVPDIVTAGLDTVGMRCPSHPLCREVIELADVPIAAPSGNTSGRPSPTMAEHMWEDMDGKIDAILDGGPCTVGVESTIVDLTCTPPRLLRPGGITLEQLESVLGEVAVDAAVTRMMRADEKPKAPGMKYRHYAPKAPVTVVMGEASKSAAYIAVHAAAEDGVICFDEYLPLFTGQAARPVMDLGPAGNKEEQARHIFDALRHFDHTDVPAIWAQCPDSKGIGLAITNRLSKAAGFHIIQV
ncbi:MAG: L-threonylcarbamoyladenylate synthase [Lawsonibacter sp.]